MCHDTRSWLGQRPQGCLHACLAAMPPSKELLVDKGYGCKAFREWLVQRGTTPVIPSRPTTQKP
ncbi:hypothetical protein [Nitrosomonas sp. Nm33]|uniref:hypothetical protein n=1 Tax=Nitrosomonas sp. Nm33 TaxID=133724 RepID=UPI00115FBAF4|nr:hypothetical protein [Nitrosomonas sp. Nm33]